MAILTAVNTEIVCLSSDRRILRKSKAYIVCTNIINIWKFLQIGIGINPVKATFCIICPYCVGKAITTGMQNIEEIRGIYSSKLLLDAMDDIGKENDLMKIATYNGTKLLKHIWQAPGH
jgi:hypothetical protein